MNKTKVMHGSMHGVEKKNQRTPICCRG